MGLSGPGARSYVCQLEQGYLKSGPGFIRLLDFLRACGCGIDSVLDILDRYTSRDSARQEQAKQAVETALAVMPALARRRAFYYDVGLRRKAGLAVRSAAESEQRVSQVLGRARAEETEKRLHRLFNDELNALHIGLRHTLAIHLRTYGRLVFATLRRLSAARPAWRAKALARLDTWPELYGLPPEPFQRFKTAVSELFDKLERAGNLD